MNICTYLRSPDIAAHCEKIDHVFSPLDMAVIITKSPTPAQSCYFDQSA